MRALHVIGLSSDGRWLLLAADPSRRPSHQLPVDDRLVRAVQGKPLDGDEPETDVLTPKQIQAQLRAGASVAEVAAAAGVPVARVERYAGPVLSEREQILTAAWAAALDRPRVGRSRVPLLAAVNRNLTATAYAHQDSVQWSARRRPDGTWVAALQVLVRGRVRSAEWAYDVGQRQLQALDAYAAQLGFVGKQPPPSAPRPAKAAKATKAAKPAKATKAAKPAKATKAAKPAKAAKAAMPPKAVKATAGGSRPRGRTP